MKTSSRFTMGRFAIVATAAALCTALLLVPGRGLGQSSEDEKAKARAETKAKLNARNFENNASVITLYDRQGKKVGTVGDRALYEDFLLSPDRTRVAVIKDDQPSESADLFVLEIETGKSTRITTSAKSEFVQCAVWSPDGRQLAFVTIRSGSEGVYRKAANGEGPEELLYKNPSAFMDLSDWSLDGRFLSFSKSDLSGGALYVLPLSGQGERAPIEVYRTADQLFGARFSPDSRFLAYISQKVNEPGKSQVYVRPFDPSGAAPKEGPWLISDGNRGRVYWRRDGKEFYYLGVDRSVMVVEVSTSPKFEFKPGKVLFRPPGAVPLFIGEISRDGERFVTVPPPRGPQLQQITIFGRDGKVASKVGEPGVYSQPAFSPDGKRLVLMKVDLASGQNDIWTMDIATGKLSRVSNDVIFKNTPMWTRDAKYIMYASFRGNYSGVYRRLADGSGSEELLFRYTPGAGLNLTDVTPDGKFLICASGGVLFTVPLTGDPQARKAIDFGRDEFDMGVGRISPDGRLLAYRSNEADPADVRRGEVWVRAFDPATGMAGDGKWQVTKVGVNAMFFWRGDGKELFYRVMNLENNDLVVGSAEVTTTPTFRVGASKVLFRVPGPLNGNLGNISLDGQRFVFAVDVPAQ